MFELIVAIIFDDDPVIFGNVAIQTDEFFPNLQNGLLKLFEEHNYSIVISGSKAFAIMFDDDNIEIEQESLKQKNLHIITC